MTARETVELHIVSDSTGETAALGAVIARASITLLNEGTGIQNKTVTGDDGNYTFSKTWTQENAQRADANSGNEFASFLLGNPASGSVDRNIDTAFSWKYYGIYVQDDWKITRRLTLNLGFRWDYEAPAAERFNRMIRGFAFDQPSPIASKVQGLTLKGGLLYAGPAGNG